MRVQVKAAGVCMSDWHIMNGDVAAVRELLRQRAVAVGLLAAEISA